MLAALAVLLRSWAIGSIGFNSDEAVYAGQAAALAGDPILSEFFTPFRAHPLLLQSALAVLFSVVGPDDVLARIVVAGVFGVGSLAATAALVREVSPRTAFVAVALLAVLPYHVVLSRQVMLDVPAVFFLVLAARALLLAVVRARRWLPASAVWLGLATSTKETAGLFVVAAALFLVWSGAHRALRRADVVRWVAIYALMIGPFVVTRLLFGGHNAGGYVLYQLLRPPNHPWWYFPVVLWEFVTPPVLALALLGVWTMLRRRSVADKLLLSWLGVFAGFHQLWPTKLFPYAIVVTPVLVIAAAFGIETAAAFVASWFGRRRARVRAGTIAVACAAAIAWLVPPAILAATNTLDIDEGPLDADVEVQDFAGGREMGRWALDHTPEGSVFLTIGPSVGNILSFYGHREWYALSVSQDPTRRNPAYRPLLNPDQLVRRVGLHYAIWDAYSADRSAFFNAMLMRIVRAHHGEPRFAVWIDVDGRLRTGARPPEGVDVRIVVYDMPGGDPVDRAGPPTSPVVDR
jgi:hypothetical protein